MKSIFFKNFITTITLFLVCFLVFGIALFFFARGYVVQDKQESLNNTAEEMVHAVNAYHSVGGIHSPDLRVNISNVARATGCHIFLVAQDGFVVSCSDADWLCPHMGQHLPPETMNRLYPYGFYSGRTDLDGFYPNAHLVSARTVIGRSNRIEGFVFVGYDSTELMSRWSTFFVLFVVMSLVLLAGAVAIEWRTSRTNTRPLREMAQAARSFSKGNFSARVTPYPGRNEISDLTDAFNSMAESLNQTECVRREFIANVSHELRTPMTSIAGFADGILDGTISRDEAPKYLQTISSETKRLSRLVRSMLDMTRLQEDGAGTAFAPYDHTEMLLQTLLNFETRINEKALDVDLDLPEEHLYALGNEDSLTRVVYNLLDNAIKFAAGGTQLSIRLYREGDRLLTRIADCGETIAPEDLPLIFERFQKTDRSRSRDRDGVGLGLYMVKAILDSHDQDIYVTSENGETAFLFTLTAAEAPAAQPSAQ